MNSSNRNPIKQWEVTFPQTDISKQTLIDSFPPYEYAICAQEDHADGGTHLHLGIKLLKGLSHAKLIKYLQIKWTSDWKRIHVSPIRNWDNWNDYCRKEDPEVLVLGSLAKRTSAVVKKALEMLDEPDKETDAEYKARIIKEREDNYASYILENTAIPLWRKKWARELELLAERCTSEELEYWMPMFREQRNEDFNKMIEEFSVEKYYNNSL